MADLRGSARRWGLVLAFASLTGCGEGAAPAPENEAGAFSDSLPVVTTPDSADAPGEVVGSPGDTVPPLTPDGWGPIRIGMSRAEIVAAAGDDANPDAVGGPDPEACDQFRPVRAPERMLLMLEQGRLTRITLMSGSEVRTERGFSVGDPATEVLERYGDEATSSPHKYVAAPAAYITIWQTPLPAPDARGIRYEIGEDGRVSHIHAGGASIEYVEGCL